MLQGSADDSAPGHGSEQDRSPDVCAGAEITAGANHRLLLAPGTDLWVSAAWATNHSYAVQRTAQIESRLPESALTDSVGKEPDEKERFLRVMTYYLSGWHIKPKG